jgi:predicted Zn-ribbon and HTH transcriptional regulator
VVFRKDLVTLLQGNQMTLVEMAHELDVLPRDLEDDIRHLRKSMKHTADQFVVTPARCRKCGFVFHKDKLHKPGKCPQCHGTWIQEPLMSIVSKQ